MYLTENTILCIIRPVPALASGAYLAHSNHDMIYTHFKTDVFIGPCYTEADDNQKSLSST